MAVLTRMPDIEIPSTTLREIARSWNPDDETLAKEDGERLGRLCDQTVGEALAAFLGGVPVRTPNPRDLLPGAPDCVEIGPARVIGGIRPQNFDVAYRPDGVRFAFDSKTLNGRKSLAKNYQNMINDLASEAATVHTRFPAAVVAFIIAVPLPCLGPHQARLEAALGRLAERIHPSDELHRAEAIALLLWDPLTATVLPDATQASTLRITGFSQRVQKVYARRYAGMPPHH
ncbi:MAG: hypothetical protein F4228_13900 [Acidobacteria bacterium]|nr:hypothetical protein [Acidobacteriota bacterium]MYF15788.1 hypothetical protein [Acidobacteriota bacterium]MYI95913.1 hypothetical protein [Acidobacteriota bacterium]